MKRKIVLLLAILFIAGAGFVRVLAQQTLPTNGSYYLIKNQGLSDIYIGGTGSGNDAVRIENAASNTLYHYFLITGNNTDGWTMQQVQTNRYITHNNSYTGSYATVTGNNRQLFRFDNTTNSSYIIIQKKQDNGNFTNGIGSDGTSNNSYIYMDKGDGANNKWSFVPMNTDLQSAIDKATVLYADGSGIGADALQTAIMTAQTHLSPTMTSGLQAALNELSEAITALNTAMATYRTANPWSGSGLIFGTYHTTLDFEGLTDFPAGWSKTLMTATGNGDATVNNKISISGTGTGNRGVTINFPSSGSSKIIYSEFDLTIGTPNIANDNALFYVLQDDGTVGVNRIINLYLAGTDKKFHLQNINNSTEVLTGSGTTVSNYGFTNTNIAETATTVSWANNTTYKIKIILDFTTHKVLKMTIDGAVVAENLNFLSSSANNISKLAVIAKRGSGTTNIGSELDNFEIGELIPTNFTIAGDADLQTIDETEVTKTYSLSGYQPALGIDVAIPITNTVTWTISDYNGVSSSIVSITKNVSDQTKAVLKAIDTVVSDVAVTISAAVGSQTPVTKQVTLKTVDLSALKAALLAKITIASTLDDAVTDSNPYLTSIIGTLSSAINTAQDVYDNSGATVVQINNAITALQTAENTFSTALTGYNNFVALIATAQALHDAETGSGTDDIKATLQTAINTATAARSTIADTIALANAVTALQSAIDAFNAAPRTATVILADFESGGVNPSFQDNGGCASNSVAVVNNPDKTCTLNATNNALYTRTNGSSQDWWKGIEINIADFTVSTSTGRYLHILMRTDLPKFEWEIHTNGDNWVGSSTSHTQNNTWFDYVIDLQSIKGTTNLNGKTVTALRIAFYTDGETNRNKEIWIDEIVLSNDAVVRGTCSAVSTTPTITINAATQYQTIEGFGASDCWMGNFVGKWSGNNKAKVAKWLFSQNFDSSGNPEGIGLSIWRMNLGAGTYELGNTGNNVGEGVDSRVARRAESFLANINTPGTYNWDKCAGQQYFLQQAKLYGCESFVAFSNSPVIPFTKNGQGYSGSSTAANISAAGYEEFANYLVDVVKHFKDLGYNFNYISPLNEPQWEWTSKEQEGTHWTNAEIKTMIINLNSSITNKGLTGTKIMLPEAGRWECLYGTGGGSPNNQIYEFFDAASSNRIGNLANVAQSIAGHSYWTDKTNSGIKSVRQSVKSKADQYSLAVHQTEWSMMEDSGIDGLPSSYSYIDVALNMAKLIHSDMAYAGASSWAYWTAMYMEQWSQKNRFMLIHVKPSDNEYANTYSALETEGQVEAEPNLWALGNYSLFVRPGYKRIALFGADDLATLMGTAYLAPDDSKVVAVYVNMATTAKTVSIDIQNWSNAAMATGSMYVTNSSNNLQKTASGIAYNTNNEITIPARSVVTLVYELPARTSFIVNTSKTSSEYLNGLYDDIIFEDGGQLTIDQTNDDGGLKPYGVVKVHKTFEKSKWYAVGFPFNIASVRCDVDGFDDYDLETYKPDGSGNDWGDYWLRTYDGHSDSFNDYTSGATVLAAGGYVLQVPQTFHNAKFTFTSPAGVTLSNSSNLVAVAGEYILTYNPSVANLSITPAEPFNYYCYEHTGKTHNFGLVNAANTRILKPFESVVVARDIQGVLRSSLGVEQSTGTIRPEGEQPVAIQYYNLQGIAVPQPIKGNIYIVKKIYTNQVSEFTKIILK